MSIKNLDGKYKVKTETNFISAFPADGDGVTEIKNGLTYRTDENGCTWESSFSILDDNKVLLESTVDPSNAPANIFIEDMAGNPTREIVVYKTTLDLTTVDGEITLSGTINHGSKTTKLTMSQI